MEDPQIAVNVFTDRVALLHALKSDAPNATLSEDEGTARIELYTYLRTRCSAMREILIEKGEEGGRAMDLLAQSKSSFCAWLLHEGCAGFAVLREDVLTLPEDRAGVSNIGRLVTFSILGFLVTAIGSKDAIFGQKLPTHISMLGFPKAAKCVALLPTRASGEQWAHFLRCSFSSTALSQTGQGGFLRTLFDALAKADSVGGPYLQNKFEAMTILGALFSCASPSSYMYLVVETKPHSADLTLLSEALSMGATNVAAAILDAILGPSRCNIPALGAVCRVRAEDLVFTPLEVTYLFATLTAAPYWDCARRVAYGISLPEDARLIMGRMMRLAALSSIHDQSGVGTACVRHNVLSVWVEEATCHPDNANATCDAIYVCVRNVLAEMSRPNIIAVLRPAEGELLAMRALRCRLFGVVMLLIDHTSDEGLLMREATEAGEGHIGELLFNCAMAFADMGDAFGATSCSHILRAVLRRQPQLAIAVDGIMCARKALEARTSNTRVETFRADLVNMAKHAIARLMEAQGE